MSDASETKTEGRINPDGKSCARKRRRGYLPQDVLFDILLRFPAEVLHDVMRHVCREWLLMIHNPNFIRHHLRNSTSGIIIQQGAWGNIVTYVQMRGGCLEISKFDCGFRGLVFTSCNGLELAPNIRDDSTLYVINPSTKQRFFLPLYCSHIGDHGEFALAFVEASMEYKVVHAIDNWGLSPRTHIAVLTVGVDKVWRHIDIQHLSLTTRREFLSNDPMVTGGYVHWISATFVLTMNVETETICRFPVPRSRPILATFLSMGSSLSLVYGEFSRNVWEMNPRTGKWIKLFTFDMRPLRHIFKDFFPHIVYQIVPFGWLEVREVLLFSSSGSQSWFVAYNIKTREVRPFNLDPEGGPIEIQYHVLGSHVKSLVRLEGRF